MKKTFTVLLFALLLCVGNAFAFTDQEKPELKKLAQSYSDLGGIAVRLGGLRRVQGEQPVPPATYVKGFVPAAHVQRAVQELGTAIEYFAGVPIRSLPINLGRATQVRGAFEHIDAAVTRLRDGRASFVALAAADASQAQNVADIDRIIASLQSINLSLGYLKPWESLDVPIVAQGGNHGDLELAIKAHGSVHHYAAKLFAELLPALQEIDGAVTTGIPLSTSFGSIYDHFYKVIEKLGHVFKLHAATWPALFDVILDSERAIIAADQAASSGIRGFDFFRLQRQFENMGAGSFNFQKPLLSGRSAVAGIGHRLYEAQEAATYMMFTAMKDPSADKAELDRRSEKFGTVLLNIAAAWVYTDNVLSVYAGFYHAMQTVAPGGPPVLPTPPSQGEQDLIAARAFIETLKKQNASLLAKIAAAKAGIGAAEAALE